VFLEVGEHDNRYTEPEANHDNWVISNRNMAAALKAKGNHYRFVYAQGRRPLRRQREKSGHAPGADLAVARLQGQIAHPGSGGGVHGNPSS
jgi:hypothetical protein